MIKVKYEYMTTRERIIDFLIQNQPYMRSKLNDLNDVKNRLLLEENPALREEIKEQYDMRIKQWVSCYTADALAIPVEWVMVELERIEMDEFLKVGK
jgi:hypothetical protein